MGAGLLSTRELSPQKNLLLSPLRYSAQVARHSSLKPQTQPKCFEAGNLRSPASPNVLRSVEVRSIADSSFSRTTRFRSMKVESLGKRPDVISKAEARDITEVANKASKEPVSSVSNLGFLASLARSATRESLQSSCGTGRFRTSGIALPTNLPHFQEESFRKTAPPNEAAEYILVSTNASEEIGSFPVFAGTGITKTVLPCVCLCVFLGKADGEGDMNLNP
ncbi:an1-type zinc finger protein 4 isoform x1 [Limosa lapponica baueri]|uniref:An1-type zinc finger protein 4 isoform x1 n=1 Tax=Limosa lapponica baueri TaxID=1758121 RepID=A0A2I0T282_LIMLA|nr:an1-type zinc finger protein 4 isoform x1 [Limosa lapponica baueri]